MASAEQSTEAETGVATVSGSIDVPQSWWNQRGGIPDICNQTLAKLGPPRAYAVLYWYCRGSDQERVSVSQRRCF